MLYVCVCVCVCVIQMYISQLRFGLGLKMSMLYSFSIDYGNYLKKTHLFGLICIWSSYEILIAIFKLNLIVFLLKSFVI
jgi:hypothetical protein